MAYSSGFLKDRITILNRKEAQQGKFGLDSAGIEFEPAATVWASVDWQRGKSGMTAGFWQGVAKMFGSDLKKPYDPEGEDRQTEELVKIWEAGDFPAFYWSLFWQDPPEMPIPEKYR